MRRLPENTLILTTEPFVGFMPVDMRAWLKTHSADADLAAALAEVSNRTSMLGHELDEVDDPWLDYAHEAWWEVEQELYGLILSSMRHAMDGGEAHYDLEREGRYYRVLPFMEKNGYVGGTGWWKKSK